MNYGEPPLIGFGSPVRKNSPLDRTEGAVKIGISKQSEPIMSDLHIERLHANLTKSVIQEGKLGDLTLTIPWTIVNALKLTSGAEVIFEVNANNDLILKPQERFEYTLDEMLEGLTPEKVHGEINWGGPVGGEEW